MLNILKKILIFIIYLLVIKKKFFKNINKNFKTKELMKLKIKNKKNKTIKFKKNLIYSGYILCSNKCPKIIKKIKKIKIKKNFFIFFSINRNENSNILEKNLNKIKKNKIYGITNNKKNLNTFSKNFKIIYKYKKNKINHSNIIYDINKKKIKSLILKNKW